jgi:hypothetical protein
MDPADLVRLTNRGMIAFDLALGTGAIAAPEATLRRMGHDAPSQDARHLFRRCGPVWLTIAAAISSPPFATSPRTGGRWPGCGAPRCSPTPCGRPRRP